MRMIPDHIPSNASPAEKLIFNELRTLDAPGWEIALHSLNLPEHMLKRECEIDFVLLGERGILGLEAKGGTLSRQEGKWHSQDLRGRRHRLNESPLDQIRSAMHALEKRLKHHLPRTLTQRTVFARGVVLPNCVFDVASVEWEPRLVLDAAKRTDTGWKPWLDELGTYWESKPGQRTRLSSADIERYLELLRPDFELVLTLNQLGNAADEELRALTDQQYRGLDGVVANDRLLVEGGAGTGKSLLAAEICRRHQDSARVLLSCRSAVLAAFLRDQPGLVATTILPFSRAGKLPDNAFDLVVLDEAQDLVNTRDLEAVDRVLEGGLADGRWVLLLDSNNQRGIVGSYEDAAMDRLRSERPTRYTLTENCRNTVEIVTATQQRTGADLGVATAGNGLEVTVLEPPANETGSVLSDLLDQLEADDVPLNEVVLLSPHDFPESAFAKMPLSWRRRVDLLDLDRMRAPAAGRPGFAEVARFKGLESPFVVLEVPPATHDNARSTLYVGMTRARVGLWVVQPSGTLEGPR